MRLSRWWRPSSADEGASLLVVLIVVAFLGVILSAITGFGATAENITTQLGGQAEATYTAGSGLDTAIKQISSNVTEGYDTAGSSCPTVKLPGDSSGVNGVAATVTCSPTSDSQPGSPGGGGVNNNNRPKEAIRTIPNAGDDGFRQASNNDLKVHGNMWTGGPISIPVSNASLTVSGSAQAQMTGPCPSNLTAGGGATCSNSVATPPDPQSDPDTTYAATWVMPTVDPSATPQTVPSGCGATKTAVLQPGRYTDYSGLTSLVSSGSCNGGIIYFSPGNYYFDFGTSSTAVWSISNPNVSIVGGLVNSWTVGQPVSNYDPTAGCASNDTTPIVGSGVAWVFAGASRIDVSNDNSIRLCAEPQTSQQEVVIWGVKNTTTVTFPPVSDERYPASVAVSAGLSPDTLPFSNFNRVVGSPDGSYADVNLFTTNSSGFAQSSVTTSGYDTTAIPSNATITGVRARIVHEEDAMPGGQNNDLNSSNFHFTVSSGSTSTSTGYNLQQGSLGADTFSLATGDFDTAAKRAAASVKVTLREDAASGPNQHRVNAKIDSIQLSFDYTLPPIVGLTGEAGTCVATGTSCPLIGTSGNAGNIFFDGTTYAPLAFLSVQLTTENSQAFSRGVVARSILSNITASSTFTGPVFDLPDLTNGPPTPGIRKVVLTVTIGTSTVGTALVQFDSPSVGDVKILSWNIRHCGKSGCGAG